jgi:hypothetical protein
MTKSESEAPEPVSDEQLQMVLEQLQRLDDAEDERRKNADARLTSVIAIMPLVIAIATSGIFPLIQNLSALGDWRFAVIPLYVVAILCFLAGILWALRALWPRRGKYQGLKIGSISKYRKPGTSSRDLLMQMIEDYRVSIRDNRVLNGNKLGEYMDSVFISGVGLAAVTLAVIVIAVGVLTGQIHPPAPQSIVVVKCRGQAAPYHAGIAWKSSCKEP